MEFFSRLRPSANTRADKGWAVKRARPSKKVWCSGLGLCLEMSLVFDFGQGLRCGLYIRHCRCHWIMTAWFFLALLPRSFVLVRCLREANVAIFCGRFSWSRQTSLSKGFFHLILPWLYYWIIFSFCYSPMLHSPVIYSVDSAIQRFNNRLGFVSSFCAVWTPIFGPSRQLTIRSEAWNPPRRK